MNKTRCLYCGAEFADDLEKCPECGAPSHYRQRMGASQKQKRFIFYFVLLVIVCFFMMFWLPR